MPDTETSGLTDNPTPAATVVVPAQDAAGTVDYKLTLANMAASAAWSVLYATAAALAAEATLARNADNLTSGTVAESRVAAAIARLASPALTGNPTAPTQSPGTNSTRLATTEFVQAALTVILGTAPGVLDTLGEIADAINDDANLYTTLVAAINAKVADAINNGTTTIAPSQNAVFDALALKAPLADPALTGTPTVPTAAAGTSTTQAASTAFAVQEAADAITDQPSLENATNSEITWVTTGSAPSEETRPLLAAAAAVRVAGKAAGGSIVASNSSAASLLAATITPVANSIAVGDRLLFRFWGTLVNDTGADATWIFRLRYGSVNLLTTGAINIVDPGASTVRPFRGEIQTLITSASSGTATSLGIVTIGAGPTTAVDSYARTAAGSDQVVTLSGWSAIDLTVQHSTASASQSTLLSGGLVIEHIKA